MKNYETANEALKRARRWYQGSIRALEDQRWDDVVYSYEMAVEQALKAILILYGIEYPKKHDISNIYLSLKNKKVPEFFSKNIDNHAKILNILVKKRGPAAYGYVEGIIELPLLKGNGFVIHRKLLNRYMSLMVSPNANPVVPTVVNELDYHSLYIILFYIILIVRG